MQCQNCQNLIPSERLEALPHTTLCVACADASGPDRVGFMVFDHKTAPVLVMVPSTEKEQLRMALRADGRSR